MGLRDLRMSSPASAGERLPMEQDRTTNPYRPPIFPGEDRESSSPEIEHEQQRLTYSLCRVGFGILSFALVLACFTSLLWLLPWFGARNVVRAIVNTRAWAWIDVPIVWGSLVGTYLLWGRWRERGWQRRSGLLLLMCFVDSALWFLEHATDLGIHEGEVGHEWLRNQLGQALGWAEFTLIAGLACDLLAHLGVDQAPEAGKATRSLAATGAVVWLILFLKRTAWRKGWPLLDGGIDSPETLLLTMGSHMIWAITLIQVTALTIAATRQTTRILRDMEREHQEHEMLRSSSEHSDFLGT
ncbi:MAG: hypothetical protein P4L84_33340 [Isosphaeraceae bacterium]|nr:hypothetical protein [Isosphaeraceae bacterium]